MDWRPACGKSHRNYLDRIEITMRKENEATCLQWHSITMARNYRKRRFFFPLLSLRSSFLINKVQTSNIQKQNQTPRVIMKPSTRTHKRTTETKKIQKFNNFNEFPFGFDSDAFLPQPPPIHFDFITAPFIPILRLMFGFSFWLRHWAGVFENRETIWLMWLKWPPSYEQRLSFSTDFDSVTPSKWSPLFFYIMI